MNYYNYDGFGVYTDTTEEPGMLCTEAAPPTAPAGQVAVFNGEAWVLMTDIRGDWYTSTNDGTSCNGFDYHTVSPVAVCRKDAGNHQAAQTRIELLTIPAAGTTI